MSEMMETFPITEVVVHSERLKSFFLPAAIGGRPGQFVMVWLPGVDEKPFAISAANEGGIEITVRSAGPCTARMMNLKKGDWLGVRGPFGNGFKPVENSILIGGGCGNAPLKYLALSLLECNYSFRWLAAARTAADLPFRELFAGENFWNPLTEDGSTGEPGRATDPLEALLSEEKPACIYASGPEPMLLAVRETALMYDVPVQLSFERYMKCAIGICGQCCLDGSGLRLCIEGPVLTEKEMCGVTEWGLSHRRASGRRP